MRTCCHTSLAFVLKFLNFLQTFVGLCMIVYSLYMLRQWYHYVPISPPPSAPAPAMSNYLLLNDGEFEDFDRMSSLSFGVRMVSGFDEGVGFQFVKLPAPWFIYFFMAVGIMLCCITCVGHIAAEAINGCCLCFYTLLTVVLILLEASLVGFLAFNHHWEKDLPFDPTGELDSFRSFIEQNIDICKWVGIAILTIQALSLLLAFVLRSLVSTRRRDYDFEEDYAIEGRTRESLLNSQSSQASGSSNTYSDIWSSRIREKYGLNSLHTKYNQNATMNLRSKQ